MPVQGFGFSAGDFFYMRKPDSQRHWSVERLECIKSKFPGLVSNFGVPKSSIDNLLCCFNPMGSSRSTG